MNKNKLHTLAATLLSPVPNMSKLHLKNISALERRAKEQELLNARWNRALNKARKVIENRIKQGKPAFSPSPPRPRGGVLRVTKPVSSKKEKKSNIQKMREKMMKKKPVVAPPRGFVRLPVIPAIPRITSKNLNASAARLRQSAAHLKASRPVIVFLPSPPKK